MFSGASVCSRGLGPPPRWGLSPAGCSSRGVCLLGDDLCLGGGGGVGTPLVLASSASTAVAAVGTHPTGMHSC